MHKTATSLPIMAHLVIGYPSLDESYRIATAYHHAGFALIEFQIPFSHPTADGTLLTAANAQAVMNGVSMRDCFHFLKKFTTQFPAQQAMAMTYFNKVYHLGLHTFCNHLASAGIRHLIIPDLPPDSKEAEEIYRHGVVKPVPVLSPNTPVERLVKTLALGPEYLYIMAGYKTTGGRFGLHPRMRELVREIRRRTDAPICVGFGISTPQQAKGVLRLADFAVIGTAFIRAHKGGKIEEFVASFRGIQR